MYSLGTLLSLALLTSAASGSVLVLNDTSFDSLTRDGTFFVNIYAPWSVTLTCSTLYQISDSMQRGRCTAYRHVLEATDRLYVQVLSLQTASSGKSQY